ncbi:hypothetical protein ACEQ8H_002678 [Pleosporales sp. CAS-2024a]
MDKKDASGESPSWRWEPWIRRDTRNAKIIEKTINKGYFIQDLENFDAAFFGISPKEAEQMDPHQRLALEVTWEALEDAGIDPKSLAGSDTAVYVGVDSDDYSRLLLEDLPNIEAWMGIGTTAHGIPNRISYHFDLMGPSAAVDAACASSLVAVHAGRQAILAEESRVAIVGGVNVCLSPALFHMLGAAGALSPDGVCLSFDEDAHGYARGEGAAILILKRMSHALLDGDQILATIKGSAIAQDGKTNGIMAPNAKAQELVARKALKQAGIDALSVGYIEAHATSTSLGDPTEVSAISAVYGRGRPDDKPAMVGSIKPNVGHLEAAAGAIGLVKSVLAVQKGIVPPQTRLNKLNTRVDWEKSGLRVVRDVTEWNNQDGPRRAAVCSYGYGGTVSHAIIEQSAFAPPSCERQGDEESDPALFLLSAPPGSQRLAIQSKVLSEWISHEGNSKSLKTISATLAMHRAPHEFRAAFVVSSHEEAAKALTSFSQGTECDMVVQGRTLDASISKNLVWIFSGHGSHWPEMGKQLLQNAVFYSAVAPLDNIVVRELGYSALDVLTTESFGGSDQIQVLTYMMQIGLSQLLRAKGIQPDAIIGHSVGEIAATVAAGSLTPEEGMLIVTRRARLLAKVAGHGSMFLVSLPFAEVSGELGARTDVVAAIDSSPSSCVVSGVTAPVTEFVEGLKSRGARVFQVKTEIAFHNPMLETLSPALRDSLKDALNPKLPSIKLYSTSREDSRSIDLRGTDYWVDNMVNPVWLRKAVTAAAEDGYRIYMEISTHPIVAHSVDETLAATGLGDVTTIPTMRKDQAADKEILHAIAQLWIKGASIDFTFMGRDWCKEVPKTKWSHKRFWKEVSTRSISAETVHSADKHNILGQKTVVAGADMTIFTTALQESNKPFPMPHQLHGTDIIPVSVYVNTFLQATGASTLSGMELRVPLAVTNDVRNVQVIVQENTVRVASRLQAADDASWVTHSTAAWENNSATAPTETFDVAAARQRIGTQVSKTFSVDYLKKTGVSGMAFPWDVLEHYNNTQEMLVTIDNDPEHEAVSWDPSSWGATLDSATSVGATLFSREVKLRIVSNVTRLTVATNAPPPKRFHLYVKESDIQRGPHTCSADIYVLDVSGALLVKIEGIIFTEIRATSSRSTSLDSLVHHIAWVPAHMAEKPLAFDQIVLVSQDDELHGNYEHDLQRHFPKIVKTSSTDELVKINVEMGLHEAKSAVIYCPGAVKTLADVSSSAHRFIWQVATAIKFIVEHGLNAKLFVVVDQVYDAQSPTALAHGALFGLARVAASEHPDVWGGLIDNEGPHFPTMPLKYVQGQDVVRYQDGVPWIAHMRAFKKDQRYATPTNCTLLPKPEGTYVITGGLGALGLETCDFLIAKGARRIVLVSRRSIPARSEWSSASQELAPILDRVKTMEKLGASIYSVAIDIGADDAHQRLLDALERLSLPPVLGVIHASGVLEDNLLVDTTSDSFERVFAPKIAGALALHKAFPPGTLDFFVLYSSIGQLVGTSGQSSYAAGNSFLDVLAAHRRLQGDNAIAFQWTAWRGLGMATSTDFLTLELQSKGITDITRDEAFQAWEHMSKYDVAQAVVTRVLEIEEDDILPCPLLQEVIVRKPRAVSEQVEPSKEGQSANTGRPTAVAELKPWLDAKIRECVASIMMLEDADEIDSRVPLADYGVDSIMTIALRQKMQSLLKIKVPQTLMWNYPTVSAMVGWFIKQSEEQE